MGWWTSADAAQTTSTVFKVDKIPAKLAYRTFDPRTPPPEIKSKLTPDEAGLCQYEFASKIQTNVETRHKGMKAMETTITGIQLTTNLTITIWTVANASNKVKVHEEAHREICEVYYARVEEIARRLAKPSLGQKLILPGKKSRDAEIDDALAQFQEKLMDEYLAETAKRCSAAQNRFDLITDHGRNAIPETDAKARAIADEPAGKASGT